MQFQIPDIANFRVNYSFCENGDQVQPKNFPDHLHDELELYILLEGDISFCVESSLYRLTPGDVIIAKPNEMHHAILNTKSVHKHICLWFETSNAFLFDDFLAHPFGENNLLSPSEAEKTQLACLYEKLKTAGNEKDSYAQFAYVLEMLSILRKSIPNSASGEALPEILRDILADIDINFKSIRSLEYFTQKYYISASTLNRLFRKHLHTTPKLHLETKRLAHSRLLLKNGKSVLEACMESGFPDYSNYIRLFKRHFDITPKQYRNTELFSNTDLGERRVSLKFMQEQSHNNQSKPQ